jgi:hypothetical protein
LRKGLKGNLQAFFVGGIAGAANKFHFLGYKFHMMAACWQNYGFGNAAESTIAHYPIDCSRAGR